MVGWFNATTIDYLGKLIKLINYNPQKLSESIHH